MDTENTSDAKKTVIINNELFRLKVDIAVLQKIQIAGQGSIKENYYTFFWHGKSVDEHRKHSVGFAFAVKNTLLQYLEVGSDGNERIITLHLHTKKGTSTLVSVYAHTLYSDKQVKYTFYEKLNLTVSKLSNLTSLSFWVT